MSSTEAHAHERIPFMTMRLHRTALLIFLLPYFTVFAQRPQYDIAVQLDTATHTLTGTISITYTNQSSSPLNELGVHLYPNAYKDNNTAFARQVVHHGNVAFAHAPMKSRGFISGLNFTVNGIAQHFALYAEHMDIGWIMLKNPLMPGKTITLSSPFFVQIPLSFSRLGRTGDAYQVTQWYPHIAVHDDEGWHTMPYLDLGEYFNDFADYQVSITAPRGYTIAATGMNTGEVQNDGNTTWTWRADNVIDFAWFASPHYQLETSTISSKEKQVAIHIYTDTTVSRNWNRVMTYAKRAVDHYTDWLGAYPYEQISVVSTPFSSAGFMEYPMVAQISYASDTAFLETVVAHEIGHTWVYGALANNERTHAWMDEGLNTFIERRYTDQYLPNYDEIAISPEVSHRLSMPQDDAWQHLIRFSGKMQPPATEAQWQSANQYILSAYTLPYQGLELLRAQVGEDMIRDMFNMYYEDHKFTHVTPFDMRSSFESICDCDLGWFFNDWIEQSHDIDYRITNWNKNTQEITIVNHGASGIPLQLTTYINNKRIEEYWIDGFAGRKTIALNQQADQVRLYESAPAVNKPWWGRVYPRPVLPFFTLFPKIGSYERPSIHVSPFAATNQSDGAMPGIVLTSGLMPQSKFKWIIAPFYGLESKELRGYAEGRFIGEMRKCVFDRWLVSVSSEYFGYEVDTHYNYRSQYLRLSPEIGLRFKTAATRHSYLTQWLKYRYVDVQQFYGSGINWEAETYSREKRSYGIHEFAYTMRSDYALRPFLAAANVQTGKGFLRINLNYNQHFRGRDKLRGLWVHGFAGWLPVYDNPEASVGFDIHGYSSSGFFSNDYMYDHWLGGRNANDGLYAHQVFPRDANLKTLVTNGVGNEWMLGAGASLALPFKYLHIYMDGAYYPNAVEQETIFSYSGGIAAVVIKDVFEIYLPLVESKDIRESLSYVVRDRWFERVAFQFNFKFANPLDLADRLTLRY